MLWRLADRVKGRIKSTTAKVILFPFHYEASAWSYISGILGIAVMSITEIKLIGK